MCDAQIYENQTGLDLLHALKDGVNGYRSAATVGEVDERGAVWKRWT